MTKVLFIKANDRPLEQAVSVQMYDAFYHAYKKANPADEVIELDLFQAELPYYGHEALTAIYKHNQGMELSEEETKYVNLANQYIDQFLSVDKIVFAFPLWNSTVPAPLITYISYLAQAGKMFNYTADGPVGYAADKKVALLCARGSDYSAMPAAEMAVNLMKTVISLWGITNPEVMVIEGHNQYPDRSQEIIKEGLEETAKLASRF